jgi:hypothetical protein
MSPAPEAGPGDVERAVLGELHEMGVLETAIGQACVVLGRDLDNPRCLTSHPRLAAGFVAARPILPASD